MPNDLDKEIDEGWETDQRLQIRSLKDAYKLGFYRGSKCGEHETLKSILSPEDAAKLESVTIGESVNYEHLADVIRAQKQVG